MGFRTESFSLKHLMTLFSGSSHVPLHLDPFFFFLYPSLSRSQPVPGEDGGEACALAFQAGAKLGWVEGSSRSAGSKCWRAGQRCVLLRAGVGLASVT